MRSRMSRFMLASVVVLAASRSWAQVAEHPVLLALSKTNHTLAIVDPVTLKVFAKMPVGPDPHEVIASAAGTRAWVSNMLNSRGHELDVLDLVNHKALPSIDTAPMVGLHGLDHDSAKRRREARSNQAFAASLSCISCMTIVKTSTSYFACTSPAITTATLSSIWFQPSI